MPLIPERHTAPEFLDLSPESYAPEELEGTLADIRVVNRYLGDRPAILKHLAAMAKGLPGFSLLDIATGSADLPIAIVEWARRNELQTAITAVDINEQTVDIARRHAAGFPEIRVEVADGLRLPYPDKSFDIVVCSKTAHHLSNEDAVRLVAEMLRVARKGYLLMDLRRSWIAYGLICLLTRIFTRNRLTRYDGPLSVLKSFTPAELTALARDAGAAKFAVFREPFWLLVLSGEIA
ncbi:methyltransferase domain-containing protein [Geomonas sp.]|uniref:methyltransferase domain-containing protein n=1 Tax=Geomonas sp. TaxID=2651584 RepID=UPI002B4A4F1A|nr:methyltransferase domain-containing protein [Geomonas sp.]HJV34531.1 methyltransferase domain-containing protein [Geomonas sp.]